MSSTVGYINLPKLNPVTSAEQKQKQMLSTAIQSSRRLLHIHLSLSHSYAISFMTPSPFPSPTNHNPQPDPSPSPTPNLPPSKSRLSSPY